MVFIMLGVGPHGVFVDANVFYSRVLRDWLGMLYTVPDNPPFQVYWSEDVLAELVYHLRRDHLDWPGGKLTMVRDRIASTFEVGRVADYQMDPSWQGPDVHDAHVHAAALACQADILLTCNATDFPVDRVPYSVYLPDEFLVLVDNSAPDLVSQVALEEVSYWLGRGEEPNIPYALKRAGCPDFAERVRRHLLRVDRIPSQGG